MSAYTELLTDIIFCLNFLDDLETGRTCTEWLFDWIQGDRGRVSANLNGELKVLKGEIKEGIAIYIGLFFTLDRYRVVKEVYEKLDSISYAPEGKSSRFTYFEMLKSHFDDLKHEISQDPKQSNNQITEESSWGVGAPGVAALFVFSVARVAGVVVVVGVAGALSSRAKYLKKWYTPSVYQDRNAKYKMVKSLHDALSQANILKIFQDNHSFVKEIIDDIKFETVILRSPPTVTHNVSEDTLLSTEDNPSEGREEIRGTNSLEEH